MEFFILGPFLLTQCTRINPMSRMQLYLKNNVFRVTEARNLPKKIEPSDVKIDKDYTTIYQRNSFSF